MVNEGACIYSYEWKALKQTCKLFICVQLSLGFFKHAKGNKTELFNKVFRSDNRAWKLSAALYSTQKNTCKTQSMQNLFEYLSYSKYTNI